MRIVYHHRTRAADAQRIHITEMVKAFRELGNSVEIASVVQTEGDPSAVSKEARLAGWQIAVRRIPFAYEVVQLGYNLIGIPLLLWKVLRSSPDFIYERYSLFNTTGVLVANLMNKPIVLEVNSPLAIEQARDRHIRSLRFARWTERTICNAATKVIVVTESLRRMMEASGVRPEKLVVMHNGVNLARFSEPRDSGELRRRLGLDGKVVIGFIGGFRNWHGLNLLIDAFHLARLGSKGAALLLIGDGPEMEPLRRQIAKLQIGESVITTGALPHSGAPEYLNLFDIAVQPAANEYCCPLKILEYMAFAKPVVAPDQANVRELLHDGEAVFFPPGDAPALGRALSELVADPVRAESLGERARQVIHVKGYLWSRNAERVIQLIERPMSRGQAPDRIRSRRRL